MNSYGQLAMATWARLNPTAGPAEAPDFEALGETIAGEVEIGLGQWMESKEIPTDPIQRQGWINSARQMVEEEVLDRHLVALDPHHPQANP
jgi:hypothetical protein